MPRQEATVRVAREPAADARRVRRFTSRVRIPGDLCPASQTLYDELQQCACVDQCDDDCADYCANGGTPMGMCVACIASDCNDQAEACATDL
jgi:hypothetical protein